MRATILGLAIFGALCGGFLGMKWLSDAAKYKEVMVQLQQLGVGKEALAEARSLTLAAWLLVLGSLIAVPTAVVNWKWKGRELIWGAVLVGCALIPALFAMKSLVFTFFLVIAGGLALWQGWKAKQRVPESVLAGAY